MKLERIEDVIVPHQVIGIDTGWQEEIYPILKAYADYMGVEMCEGTSIDRIKSCELALHTTLPDDLRIFYSKFGAAHLEEKLFDVEEFEYITTTWGGDFIDNYTKEEQNVLKKLIVFGDYLGNGNVWCFHQETKDIFYFKHDSRPNINQMFETFYEYLQALLIFTQAEIGQDIDDFDEGCERLVVDLIGKDRVKVWRYFSGWE